MRSSRGHGVAESCWVPGSILLGVLVGLIIPSNSDELGGRISHYLGWMSFCAWTLSFYPQLIRNFQRRSVVGLSLEFQLLNIVGYLFYSIFNATMYWSPHIQNEYSRTHGGYDSIVKPSDVFFALHGFANTAVQILQIWVFYDCPPLVGQDLVLRRVVVLCVVGLVSTALLSAAVIRVTREEYLTWLTYLQVLASCKVALTTVKYCPQVLLQCRRRSTEGWAIHNVLLDLLGAGFSIAQLVLDARSQGGWLAVVGDPAKLLLGNITVIFDGIFIVQHYCLYGETRNISSCSPGTRHELERSLRQTDDTGQRLSARTQSDASNPDADRAVAPTAPSLQR